MIALAYMDNYITETCEELSSSKNHKIIRSDYDSCYGTVLRLVHDA